tara:strand:- start:85 stop:363 length:279 start_codon:yes stop_codon:yes gene_type:complete
MKHNIKISINKNEISNWEQLSNQANYSRLVKDFDIEDKQQFVDDLIKEFENTDASLIPVIKEKLILWLETMDDKDLDVAENEKLRDFIYEMF